MRERSQYIEARRRFEPRRLNLIIVAESPPASGLYFYDPNGAVTEPLFLALMKRLGAKPASKDEGLRIIAEHGGALVDATYEPVDKNRDRDAVLLRDYALLHDDLLSLNPTKQTGLILIKANVCRLLEPRLKADGFNVLNKGRAIYFPSHGNQNRFQEQFASIID